MSEIISLKDVFYSYPQKKEWQLNGINLSINKGEFLVLMGENGAGKTTFCKLINGLIPQHSGGRLLGSVIVDGDNTQEIPVVHLALKVGMVLDDPDAQLFTSSVRYEAAFGPENLLLSSHDIIKRVEYALSVTGLTGFEERSPVTLSGGEKQRLVIAASLASAGKILVLDEPLARLDPQGEEQVMSVLGEIKEKYGITIIMAANSCNGIVNYADRVCILKNGSIVILDSAKKIFSSFTLLEEYGIQPPVDFDIIKTFPINNYDLPVNEKETPVIKINSLYYSYYGKTNYCIENLNLSITENEFTAIIGNNGCGKTTLLKNLTGLLQPETGDIFIRGKSLKEMSITGISGEIGFIMQNPDSQLFTDSVYNEVSYALKNSGLSKTEIKIRTENALRITGLEEMDAYPPALSRSERTRVIIACVIAMGCKIIILDEPDIGQDYRGSIKIMNIVKELHSLGHTIIFVTHNLYLACKYAHRLIKMDNKGIIMDRRRMVE